MLPSSYIAKDATNNNKVKLPIPIIISRGTNINFDFLYNKLDRITASQKIAPQRLFVNVWRIARNEYVDSSMNHQNWMRWRNRYLKNIKTMEDANVAINTMLTSLNDPYTKFLMTELYTKQKQIASFFLNFFHFF